MRSRLNKRKRDSSPDSLQPSRRRTPSNLLVAESPDRPKSSVDSSPDSPPPGKMVLSFLNNIHWPVHMDIPSPSPSWSQSRTTTHSGQLSDGVSTCRGGGEYNTLMSELKKMRGPNPTDLTSEEYYWAVNYFSVEHRSPIFFELDVQDRLPYIKRSAAK